MTYQNDYLIMADEQAREIRAILLNHSELNRDRIEKNYGYANTLSLHDWFNGREQGYCLSVSNFDSMQHLHIAFYEHRNSDLIHILLWEQNAFNPICTVDEADFSELSFEENKWGTYYSFYCGETKQAAEFIVAIAHEFLQNPTSFVEDLYKNKGIYK